MTTQMELYQLFTVHIKGDGKVLLLERETGAQTAIPYQRVTSEKLLGPVKYELHIETNDGDYLFVQDSEYPAYWEYLGYKESSKDD